MVEETLEIRTADGVAEALLYRGDDTERRPGAIHLTDIGGIRDAQRDKARRLADAGYTVLMPNIFYRTGKPPFLSDDMTEDAFRSRIAELRAPLGPDAMERDVATHVDVLVRADGVAQGPIGVVGYCFSGKMALYAAAVRADRVAAAASFHGGHLVTEDASSPHLLLPRIRARLYFGHAVNDASMPAGAIAKLDDALRRWGGRFESEVYESARHSWTEPDSPAYNEPQAERAFAKLLELFDATLKR